MPSRTVRNPYTLLRVIPPEEAEKNVCTMPPSVTFSQASPK